jgi:hypothetical protein
MKTRSAASPIRMASARAVRYWYDLVGRSLGSRWRRWKNTKSATAAHATRTMRTVVNRKSQKACGRPALEPPPDSRGLPCAATATTASSAATTSA